MELSVDDALTSNVQVASSDGSVVPNNRIFVCDATVKDGIIAEVQNVYPSDNQDELMQGEQNERTGTSIPIYLFAAAPSSDISQFSLSTNPQKTLEKNEDAAPRGTFAYYSTVQTSNPQLISFVSKADAVDSFKDNQLSEDVLNSFVLGSGQFTTPVSISMSVSKSNEAPVVSPLPSTPLSFTIADHLSNRRDFGLQTCDLNDVRDKKEIVIFTDNANADGNAKPSENLMLRSPFNKTDDFLTTDSNNFELITSICNADLTTASMKTPPRKQPVSSKQTSSVPGVFSVQGSEKALTAEELLRRQPVLHMNCSVEAEITDSSGATLGREVTTQTVPLRRMNTVSKNPVEKRSAPKRDDPPTPELKVILTTDDDANFDFDPDDSDSAENRMFRCTRCSLKFLDEETLFAHMKCHVADADEKYYACYVCGYANTHWLKMHNHLFSHGLKKPYQCTECSFSCLGKSDLATHMFVHSSTKLWMCEKCNRSFKHRRNMKSHLRNCLGLDKAGKPIKGASSDEFVCRVCQKQLSNKRNLSKHMEIHMDVKPFVCNLCGHATRLKESLITHKRLHTGEKPFKCDICDYSTPDKSSLRRHMRKHTNEKPYSCKFCDYKAIQKHCLDAHVHRKHTGEKFICGLCSYETYHRYGLNQHFKHHHQDDYTQAATETCVVTPATVVLSSNNGESVSSSNLYLSMPVTSVQSSTSADASFQQATTSGAVESTNNETIVAAPLTAVQSSIDQPSAIEVVQQIQQPGDVVYLQENGNIFIKKEDGRVLFIQQMDEADPAS